MEFCPTVNIRSFPGTNNFPQVEDISKALTKCLRGVGKKQHSIKEKGLVEKEKWRESRLNCLFHNFAHNFGLM